jgi:hypothetical protein
MTEFTDLTLLNITWLFLINLTDIPPCPPSKGGIVQSPPLKGDLGGCSKDFSSYPVNPVNPVNQTQNLKSNENMFTASKFLNCK